MIQNTDSFIILLYCKLPSCGWGIIPLINRIEERFPGLIIVSIFSCGRNDAVVVVWGTRQNYIQTNIYSVPLFFSMGVDILKAVSCMPAAMPSQIAIFK